MRKDGSAEELVTRCRLCMVCTWDVRQWRFASLYRGQLVPVRVGMPITSNALEAPGCCYGVYFIGIKDAVAAGQGRVIKPVRTQPRKAGQPPGCNSSESGW